MLSFPGLVAALVTAVILGETAVAGTPVFAGQDPAPWTCEVVDDAEVLELDVVLRIITRCQDALGLTDAQREQLGTLTVEFVVIALRYEGQREMVEETLVALLRPDRKDPGRPIDLAAAEVRIREVERLTADQESRRCARWKRARRSSPQRSA